MSSHDAGSRSEVRRRAIGLAVLLCCGVALLAWAGAAGAAVLTVGTFNGKNGKFKSIEAAVEKARPGDWVLIHVGFALSKVDEEEARASLEFLNGLGQAFADEIAAISASEETPEAPLKGGG